MKIELIKRIISSIILIPTALFFIIKGSFLFNFFINKDLSIDFGYHIQYSKINFSEQLNKWGIQQSIFARAIVNGSKYLSNLND